LLDDKELADRVVALGIGGYAKLTEADTEPYDFYGDFQSADQFVRDWRVAGALMEKCIGMAIEPLEIDSGYGRGWEVCNCFSVNSKFGGGDHCYKFCKAENESLPRAIIEACVEALDVG